MAAAGGVIEDDTEGLADGDADAAVRITRVGEAGVAAERLTSDQRLGTGLTPERGKSDRDLEERSSLHRSKISERSRPFDLNSLISLAKATSHDVHL